PAFRANGWIKRGYILGQLPRHRLEGGMVTASPQEVTQLLHAWSRGEEAALEQLIPLIYKELRQRAHRYMDRERAGHSLQTTALINEAYLRLVGSAPGAWESRSHFFAIASRLMLRVPVCPGQGP